MKQNIFLVNFEGKEKREKHKYYDNDINNIKIKDLFNDEYNKKCFDCNRLYPENISINNGVFICNKCAEYHYKLKANVSKITKFILAELSFQDMRYIYYGGNKKLSDFIDNEYPCLKLLSNEKKYNTKAMEYYRANLKYLVEGGKKPEKPSREGGYILSPQKNENENSILSHRNLTFKKLDFSENNINEDNDENIIVIDFRNHQHYVGKNNLSPNLTEIIKNVPRLKKNNTKNVMSRSGKIQDLSFIKRIPMKKTKNDIKLKKKIDNRNKLLNINFKNNKSIEDIKSGNKIEVHRYNSKNSNRNNSNNDHQHTRKINIKLKEINLKDLEINSDCYKITNNSNNLTITNNNTVYSKPKHTLLNVFKKNISNENKMFLKDRFTEPILINSLSDKNIYISKKNNKDNTSFDYLYNKIKNNQKSRNIVNESNINKNKLFKTQTYFYNLSKSPNFIEKSNTLQIKNNNKKIVFKKKAIQNKIRLKIDSESKNKVYKNIQNNTQNKPNQSTLVSKNFINDYDNISLYNISNNFNTLTKDLNDNYEEEIYTDRMKINNSKEYLNYKKLPSIEKIKVKNLLIPPLKFCESNKPKNDNNTPFINKNNIKIDLKSLILSERYKKMQISLGKEKKANKNESKDNKKNNNDFKYFKKKINKFIYI